jgi:hypothetical protein
MGKRQERKLRMCTKCHFNNTDLHHRGVETRKRTPVTDNKASTNNIRTLIDSASLVTNISNEITEEEEKIGQTTRGICNRLESSS